MLRALKHTKVELPNSINYIKLSKRWPTTVFLASFSTLTAVQVLILHQSDFNRPFSQSAPISGQTPQPHGPQPQNNHTKAAAPLPESPTDIRPLSAPIGSEQFPSVVGERPQQALDLNDPQNIRAIQLRLHRLGYLYAHSAEWDSRSRQALRDFKTVNNLPPDDRWDIATQEQLISNSALRYNQTYLGFWSEGICDVGAKPDLHITSRGATSATGGFCAFRM